MYLHVLSPTPASLCTHGCCLLRSLCAQDPVLLLTVVAALALVVALCARRGHRKPALADLKEPLLPGEEEVVVPQLAVGVNARGSAEQEHRLFRLWTDDDWLVFPVPARFAAEMVTRGVFARDYTLLDDAMRLHQLLRELPRIVSNPTSLRGEGVAWASLPSGYRPDMWDAMLALYTLSAPYSGSESMARQPSQGGDVNRSVSR